MTAYLFNIPPEEIIRVVRAETDAAGGQPEFYLHAWLDFVIEENYDRRAFGILDGQQYDLVTVEGVLNIEPRLEQNYWVLSIMVRKILGPQIIEDENALISADLTLEEFEAEFISQGDYSIRVRLEAQTPAAKRHFDLWWTELSARYPPNTETAPRDHI